jgi:DNA-directed RNA polymerase subunit RPC12/RpoP
MPNPTYFVQECPTCGRSLHIRVEYLGRRVVCQHCRGAFLAADPAGRRPLADSAPSLLQRAEELLEHVSQQAQRPLQRPR